MQELTQYRKAADQIIIALRYTLQAVLTHADYSDRERLIDTLTPQLTEITRQHRARVYDEAVVMLKRSARSQGVTDPYVPSISGYSEDSVRTLLRKHLRGTPQEAAQAVSAALAQHVEAAGRQVIVRAVEDGVEARDPADEAHLEHTRLTPEQFEEEQGLRLVYDADDDTEGDEDDEDDEDDEEDEERRTPLGRQPVAWARVLSGAENCGFCVMLASRGPVYSSAAEAGRGQASDRDYAAGINTYHTNCDCLVVPVYDYASWPGRDQWLAAERVYKKVISQNWSQSYNAPHLREKYKGTGKKGISASHGPSGVTAPGQKRKRGNNVVNAMDRYLRSHDIAELHGVENIRAA